MNYLNRIAISLMLSALCITSCNDRAVSFSRIEYFIPDHISIKAKELDNVLGGIKTDPSSTVWISVVIYSYSSGAETISITGEGDFKTAVKSGRVKALVKVMDGNKIQRVVFVEGGGNSKEEMLSSLAKDAKLKLKR